MKHFEVSLYLGTFHAEEMGDVYAILDDYFRHASSTELMTQTDVAHIGECPKDCDGEDDF